MFGTVRCVGVSVSAGTGAKRRGEKRDREKRREKRREKKREKRGERYKSFFLRKRNSRW